MSTMINDTIELFKTITNDLIEKPNETIIEKRIKIIKYLSELYRLCWGESAQGLHDKFFSAYSKLLGENMTETDKLSVIDANNQEQLETILALTNTFFCRYDYEILYDIVIKLRRCLQYTKAGTWIPTNNDEFACMLDSLQYLIRLMKHQLYRKRLFGRWFPQLTLCYIR